MPLNHLRKSPGEKVFDGANILFLAMLIILTIYPMLYVLFASFSNGNLLLRHSGILFAPIQPTVRAYKVVMNNPMILKGYINTMFLLGVGVTFQLFMTMIAAYFLSRKNVMFKTPVMMMIVFTMFFNGGMIPFYLTVQGLNLIDTRWSLIFPFAISTYNMIIMRTSFNAIPDSMEESARIDGAGHFTILFRIIMPLSKAVIAVIILYYGVGVWNAWFWASKFIRTRDLYPLQVILREILILNDMESMTGGVDQTDQEAISESVRYATIVVATVPILAVYPFMQKYFVQGVMIGALKG